MIKYVMPLAIAIVMASGVAQATTFYQAGQTSVMLSPIFISAAQQLKLTLNTVGASQMVDTTVMFPVTNAVVDDSLKAEINHSGGLSISNGNTMVELRRFSIQTTTSNPSISGLVLANDMVAGRIPLFMAKISAQTPSSTGTTTNRTDTVTDTTMDGSSMMPPVTLNNIALTLGSDAAKALNAAFKTTAFAAGLSIGTATVTLTMDE